MSIKITEGHPDPLGLSFEKEKANFALFSSHANQVFLGLFWDGMEKKIPMNRTGDIWHVSIEDVPPHCSYAYQCNGPKEHLYNAEKWLADPYAKVLADNIKAKVEPLEPFDWQGIKPPQIPKEDLIIYEAHVRGFTRDASAQVSHPGTYLGFIEKIPHLKKLGINAVELMPIFQFDEKHTKNPPHVNYWGYNTTHFFTPKLWYGEENPVSEFKTLVRELHKNGILVILDVVYNHSGEDKDKNYYVNFRGIDNCVYYLVNEKGEYIDYTGCGNTINHNHPMVQKLILDSLTYWVEEMHVDGFRFDLASIFTRDLKGKPMAHPPLLEAIGKHPILGKKILIAEAWDAAGLYQLGSFPKWGPWSEWNGRYRDIVRRFIKGTDGQAGQFAAALCGSDMIYRSSHTPLSSINFITVHDGYCLRDLVSYQGKHNWDNGENNRDGNNSNDSWNCGIEGPSEDPNIIALREQQMRNFLLALLVSQGIPMLLMGDEYGHTRYGNNNPYVQDNHINWFLWDELASHQPIFQFVASLIAFRKTHKIVRHTQFLVNEEVEWFSNWNQTSRLVAFHLKNDTPLFIVFNASCQPTQIHLPDGQWKKVVDTKESWIFHKDPELLPQQIELAPYSSLLAKSS